MSVPDDTSPKIGRAQEQRALFAMMIGNLVIATGALLPTGIINNLSSDLNVSIPKVATLISYGALVLCIGAPVLAFLTNRIDRRLLLGTCLLIYTIGHVASALVSNFESLLAVRLSMIAAAAVFTPQAASTIGVFVAPERRAGALAFVFIGWSFAIAVVIPLTSLIAAHMGWRTVYAIVAVMSGLATLAVWFTLKPTLKVAPLSLALWGSVLTNPRIVSVLAVTLVSFIGQFTLFPYVASEFARIADAGPELVALALGVSGVGGILGTLIVTRIIGRVGTTRMIALCIANTAFGLALWAAIAHDTVTAIIAIAVWGLAFSSSNALQQARLIAVSPDLASASVALNTSVLYVGQAIGTSIGAVAISASRPDLLGWIGAAIALCALAISVAATRVFRA